MARHRRKRPRLTAHIFWGIPLALVVAGSAVWLWLPTFTDFAAASARGNQAGPLNWPGKMVSKSGDGAGPSSGLSGSLPGGVDTSGNGGGMDRSADRVMPAVALLNVPAQAQFPQLNNGCEATSVSMLLTAYHRPFGKMEIASMEPRDSTPIAYGPNQQIVSWGNPNFGFVGNVVQSPGYGIYHGPVATMLNQIVPGQVIDMTGQPFDSVLASVADGMPVVVWTNATFKPTNDWITWKSPTGLVHATLWEHAVLVVGYTPTTIIINNPLNGAKDESLNRQQFLEAWDQMGKQAITLKPADGGTQTNSSVE